MRKIYIKKNYLGSQAIDKNKKVNKPILEKIVNMDPIAILEYAPSEYQITEKYRVVKSPSDLAVKDNWVSADQLKIWLDTIPIPCVIYERENSKNIFKIYNMYNGGKQNE